MLLITVILFLRTIKMISLNNIIIIVSITKFSIVIGYPRACFYVIGTVTWVSYQNVLKSHLAVIGHLRCVCINQGGALGLFFLLFFFSF